MRFHLGILPNRAIPECGRLAGLAEEFGYAGFWVADSHSVFRDAYIVLGNAAIATQRILLAPGVTPTPTRHPAAIASAAASLQELSGGRLLLGLGVGDSAVRNLGLRPERLAAFERKLMTIRGLLRGESVHYEGQALRMPWARFDVPIIMACSGPKSLQLGGRLADGVLFQVGSDPAFVRYALDNIRAGAEAVGRRLEELRLIMRVACCVSEDRGEAREAVKGYAAVAAGTTFSTVSREYFDPDLHAALARFKAAYDYQEHGSSEARHGKLLTDRILDAIAIAGTPAEVIPRFQEIAALGVREFCWTAGMPQPEPFIREFATQVMPALRGAADG
ncbi:MAG: LLM class flavin-dependent oxidoreductase [Gammaproteobacteria bacterium]|nr:MAG: LLM class flavin-dependent oxidoreductase [Gammaproteobacteria bacterium]